MAIGGPGLPAEAKLRQDLPDAGLTNVTGAIMNLLGFQARMLHHCWACCSSAVGLVICSGSLPAAPADLCCSVQRHSMLRLWGLQRQLQTQW